MLLKNYYYYFKSALSPKFCDEVLKYGKLHTMQDAVTHVNAKDKDFKTTMDEMTNDEKTHVLKKRKSNIAWMNDRWIYQQIHPYIHEANEKAGWNFQWDFSESCQFTKYDTGQFYDWHSDGHPTPYKSLENDNMKGKIRKLSVTVSLNDPNEYEGGNLEFDFRNGKDYQDEDKNSIRTCTEIRPKGSIVVFPSFVWHRVTPVTKGTRYSLVMWNLGWPFK